MTDNRMEEIKGLLKEDEKIAYYEVEGFPTAAFCIVPAYKPFSRVGLGKYMKQTLLRIEDKYKNANLEQREETIYLLLHAKRQSDKDTEMQYFHIDENYVLPGRILDAGVVALTDHTFQKRMYERYKLQKLSRQGYGLADLIQDFSDFADSPINVNEDGLIPEWEKNHGWIGNIYASFSDFVYDIYPDLTPGFFLDGEKERWERDQLEVSAEQAEEPLRAVSKSHAFRLTAEGRVKCARFLREYYAFRKEILDAGKDTCDNTMTPDISDIEADLSSFTEDGIYVNGWGVTDHYDLPILLEEGIDFTADQSSL